MDVENAHASVSARAERCPGCGYSVEGLRADVGVCPECGGSLKVAAWVVARRGELDFALTLLVWGVGLAVGVMVVVPVVRVGVGESTQRMLYNTWAAALLPLGAACLGACRLSAAGGKGGRMVVVACAMMVTAGLCAMPRTRVGLSMSSMTFPPRGVASAMGWVELLGVVIAAVLVWMAVEVIAHTARVAGCVGEARALRVWRWPAGAVAATTGLLSMFSMQVGRLFEQPRPPSGTGQTGVMFTPTGIITSAYLEAVRGAELVGSACVVLYLMGVCAVAMVVRRGVRGWVG